jgi:2-polyprenyl-3-methyl-5-hydroxy-6-metoxy-1,4-benzoquinol methylase
MPTSAPIVGNLFQKLEASYNLLPHENRDEFFLNLILDNLTRRASKGTVIDIGCGKGIGLDASGPQRIRALCENFIGIEPDKSIVPAEGTFTQFIYALFEDSKLPDNSVDFAYSYMVMEHVQNPTAFMKELWRVLKPGGQYMFMTPNGRHYFAKVTNTLRSMNLDEKVLKVIRPKATVEGYHYPTAYKFNKPVQIEPICKDLGFLPPRYVFSEQKLTPYFPGPTKLAWRMMTAKRKMIKTKQNLLELTCLISKPG